MKNEAKINLIAPLENVNDKVYSDLLKTAKRIKVITDGTTKNQTEITQSVLTNYSYLIYEVLELNKTRDINYSKVKRFVTKHKRSISFVLGKYIGNKKIDFWLKGEDVGELEMAMYSPTSKYNKNIYH